MQRSLFLVFAESFQLHFHVFFVIVFFSFCSFTKMIIAERHYIKLYMLSFVSKTLIDYTKIHRHAHACIIKHNTFVYILYCYY